jgi:WD40 repeat protein
MRLATAMNSAPRRPSRSAMGATRSASPVPIYGHSSDVYDVAFTPDGRTLVSVSSDKTIRLWNNKSFADYRDMLCRIINRRDAKLLWEQAEPNLHFPGVC